MVFPENKKTDKTVYQFSILHYFAFPKLLHPFTHVTEGGPVILRILLSQVIKVPHRAILKEIKEEFKHSHRYDHRPEEENDTLQRLSKMPNSRQTL